MNTWLHLGEKTPDYRSVMRDQGDIRIGDKVIPASSTVIAEQIAGDGIHICSDQDSGAGWGRHPQIAAADALITNLPGQYLLIRTADCYPVLLTDAQNRAVAAIHSGREGTRLNIAGKAVRALEEHFGIRPAELTAHIGAGICARHYEVVALKRNRPGRLRLSPQGLEFQAGKGRRGAAAFQRRPAGDWAYCEETGQRPTLTLIGGGHVALALSRIMTGLDFHVRVLDDRPGLATLEENEAAQEKHVVSFRSVGRLVEEGELSYAVIMTYGHQADEKVLAQLAGKRLRYLGLLGSPAKNARIFASLRRRRVSRSALERVHAPVGLAIHSRTPEEIAVSIAAEIIQVKNQPKLQ